MNGKLIIFSAPSGSGKSTIINWLMSEHKELCLAFSISCTSRAPRGTEQNGVEYFFLSPEDFKEKIANDEFLEYEEVYTDRFYGTLKSQVESQRADGQNVVFDVDVKGGCNIKRYYGVPTHTCVCSPGQIMRYMNKISGPLFDRIDIQCAIQPVPFEEISKAEPGEPSEAIRQRVIAARKIQEERFKEMPKIHCNAQMTERMIHKYATPDEAGVNLLRTAMTRLNLSARAYNRILKVARTIADLDNSESLTPAHLAEAISYRQLDRADWAERGF